MKKSVFSMVLGLLVCTACNDDDIEEAAMADFTMTIENITEPTDYFMSGSLPGIPPGESHTFSFHAGEGHILSLATMLAQSNDLFYGFADEGLMLYNGDGTPVTGEQNTMLYLWDAGTEVNEEPGTGPNQAPRQPAPDTGPDEGGTIRRITNVNDGFTYPDNTDMISIVLAHDGGTEFTATIENMSGMTMLGSPFAPGVWAVHGDGAQLFEEDGSASGALEKLAEDGINADLADALEMNTGLVSPFAPGVYAVYVGTNPVFADGQQASGALEALAEDGDPSAYDFSAEPMAAGAAFTTPVSGGGPAPIFPGEQYRVSFTASEGDNLAFATMLVQSNDLFAGAGGIALFSNGMPVSGDITGQVEFWDAYTEVNQFPGAGGDQAPRQSGPDTGPEESGNVGVVSDAFTYPAVSDMLRVTITAN